MFVCAIEFAMMGIRHP